MGAGPSRIWAGYSRILGGILPSVPGRVYPPQPLGVSPLNYGGYPLEPFGGDPLPRGPPQPGEGFNYPSPPPVTGRGWEPLLRGPPPQGGEPTGWAPPPPPPPVGREGGTREDTREMVPPPHNLGGRGLIHHDLPPTRGGLVKPIAIPRHTCLQADPARDPPEQGYKSHSRPSRLGRG